MPVPDAVKAWLTELMGGATADATETPETLGEGEDPTEETPEGGAETVEDGTTPGESNTLPEPDTQITDAERDAMGSLAAENEALREENADLRNRIAELGGDTTLGITEEVVETIDDPEDDYDAEADVAEQEAEVARLRGDNNPEKD